jgi:ABC-type branched-subunit amino acid transport system ATPase component
VAGKHDDRAKAVRERAEGLFGTFPLLTRLRHRRAGLLSGGEQQVLAIARGLMSEPTVLAIDEPSMGLAPVVIRDVMGMLRAATSSGTAVLLVEQNLALAGEIANRMYILSQGRIRGEGRPEELPPDLLERYLGMEVPPGALPDAGLGAPT